MGGLTRTSASEKYEIIRLELLLPFSYLRHVTERVQNSGGSAVEGKNSDQPSRWSLFGLRQSDDPARTRTQNLLIKRYSGVA
jgi:hypothetical protein